MKEIGFGCICCSVSDLLFHEVNTQILGNSDMVTTNRNKTLLKLRFNLLLNTFMPHMLQQWNLNRCQG